MYILWRWVNCGFGQSFSSLHPPACGMSTWFTTPKSRLKFHRDRSIFNLRLFVKAWSLLVYSNHIWLFSSCLNLPGIYLNVFRREHRRPHRLRCRRQAPTPLGWCSSSDQCQVVFDSSRLVNLLHWYRPWSNNWSDTRRRDFSFLLWGFRPSLTIVPILSSGVCTNQLHWPADAMMQFMRRSGHFPKRLRNSHSPAYNDAKLTINRFSFQRESYGYLEYGHRGLLSLACPTSN